MTEEVYSDRLARLCLGRALTAGRGEAMALAHMAGGTDQLMRAIGLADFASCDPIGIVLPSHGRDWCELVCHPWDKGEDGATPAEVDGGYMATEPGRWAVMDLDSAGPDAARFWLVTRYRLSHGWHVAGLVIWTARQTLKEDGS